MTTRQATADVATATLAVAALATMLLGTFVEVILAMPLPAWLYVVSVAESLFSASGG